MKRFADLYLAIDASTSTLRKTAAMVGYFQQVPAEDAAWAVYFLAGGRPGRLIPSRELRAAALQVSGLPAWLFEESYQAVGDLAETIAHVLPPAAGDEGLGLAQWMAQRILTLRGATPQAQRDALIAWWQALDAPSRFVLNKLLTGGMRVGVSRLLVTRALAQAFDLQANDVTQRIIGYTDKQHQPDAAAFKALVAPVGADAQRIEPGRPYPFFLAHPLSGEVASLGDLSRWQVEWKWDGIRAQLIRRDQRTWIWSRGEDLLTERFPEILAMSERLPDGTVIDGELLCWDGQHNKPLPFSVLQTRIGRKKLSARVLSEAPAILMAYDLLETGGTDIRQQPQLARRAALQATHASCADNRLLLSQLVVAPDWQALDDTRSGARAAGVEGLMLKALDTSYGVGRTRSQGDEASNGRWLKWKLDPLTVDCVLVYAQRGHGRRASLYTDYTFAVWDQAPGQPDRKLITFAKAYSGLTDAEIKQVDAVIRKTTIEKFGPVRSVTPSMVFELGFEAIAHSSRHKSGVAVRFPRILRIRDDKPIDQADTLAQLKQLLGG